MSAAWSRLRPALGELALAFAGLLLGVAVLRVLTWVGVVPKPEGEHLNAAAYLGGPAVTVIAALFYRAISRVLDEEDPGIRGDPAMTESRGDTGMPVTLTYVVLGIVAALIGSFTLGTVMEQLGFPVQEQEGILKIIESAQERGAVFELVALAVAATVLAPLAEEWLFRGSLFRRLLRVAGRPEAYILSACAFAMIHGNPAGFVIYTWLGLVFAYTYRRTGRLWTAMVVHTGNNAFALTLLLMAEPLA